MLFSIIPFPLWPALIHTDIAWEAQHPPVSKVCRLQLLLLRGGEGGMTLHSALKVSTKAVKFSPRISSLHWQKWEVKRDQMNTPQGSISEPGLLGKLLPLSEKPWKIRRNKLSIRCQPECWKSSVCWKKARPELWALAGATCSQLRKSKSARGEDIATFSLQQLNSNPALVAPPNCRGDRHVLLTAY